MMVMAGGLGEIGVLGAGTGDLSRAPVAEDAKDRVAVYIKQKEMATRGVVQI